jgi:hypothetical protein
MAASQAAGSVPSFVKTVPRLASCSEVFQGLPDGGHTIPVRGLELVHSTVLFLAALEGGGLEDYNDVEQFPLPQRVLHEVAVRTEVDNQGATGEVPAAPKWV